MIFTAVFSVLYNGCLDTGSYCVIPLSAYLDSATMSILSSTKLIGENKCIVFTEKEEMD